ncbi:MAG: hypothetical protein ACR2P1_04815 [Pseudomonadales bacterium]
MALANYLSNYAEPHSQQFGDFPYSYDYACVVPCCEESEDFLLQNRQVFDEASSLVIVVINEATSEKTNTNNLALHKFIRTSYTDLWESKDESLTLLNSGKQSHLLCVDAYTAGRQLPAQQGVGLARKIGADIACQLYYAGKIAKPWIFTTDADVVLPLDYFNATANVSQAAAFIFSYQHSRPSDPKQALAIDLYDYSLRYYTSALQWAGSPYAFQTVGSTLAIHAEHYAKVRGFPKRSAGEDFYILNKLRKTGAIVSLNEPVIKVSARISNRTPFGTGAALSQIMELENPEHDYVFYHPKVFELLRQFLHALPDIWQQANPAISEAIENEKLLHVLQSLDIESGIQHAITHSKTLEGFLKHMHDWFDAFRTLKLIHGLRDAYYPSINIMELRELDPEYIPDLPIRDESSEEFRDHRQQGSWR